MEKLKEIIESLLFVSETALTIERIRQVTEAESREIRETLKLLADEYEGRGGGFYLSEVAGGYQIRTRPAYNDWIKRLIQPNPPRMSKAALETLAIIAYKQPIIRSDIEHVRGVDSGGVLRVLLERKLIRVLGRKEIPGRPLIYATTKHFLEVFDLKDLKDLPTPKEIASFGRSLLDESPPDESFEPQLGPPDAAAEDAAEEALPEVTAAEAEMRAAPLPEEAIQAEQAEALPEEAAAEPELPTAPLPEGQIEADPAAADQGPPEQTSQAQASPADERPGQDAAEPQADAEAERAAGEPFETEAFEADETEAQDSIEPPAGPAESAPEDPGGHPQSAPAPEPGEKT